MNALSGTQVAHTPEGARVYFAFPANSYVPAARTGTVIAAEPQQPPAQAPSPAETAAGASVIVVLILGFLIHRAHEKKKIKSGHLIMAFAMGVLLSGSFAGIMVRQIADSGGSALASVVTGLTGDSGSGSGAGR